MLEGIIYDVLSAIVDRTCPHCQGEIERVQKLEVIVKAMLPLLESQKRIGRIEGTTKQTTTLGVPVWIERIGESHSG